MPHTIRFNKDLGVIVLRAKHSMDVVELEAAFTELVRLEGFKEGLSLIVDFRGSTTPLTTVELRQLATYAGQTDAQWGDTKWSFLASADVTYGLSRMFMALTSKHQVETHVFRNVKEADGWLGLGVDMDEILVRTPDGTVEVLT
ncbi:MAG: hypothetical protein PSV46_21885 [Reyranella sp.]|nr:hypothetical protein [Reyranella sp.]